MMLPTEEEGLLGEGFDEEKVLSTLPKEKHEALEIFESEVEDTTKVMTPTTDEPQSVGMLAQLDNVPINTTDEQLAKIQEVIDTREDSIISQLIKAIDDATEFPQVSQDALDLAKHFRVLFLDIEAVRESPKYKGEFEILDKKFKNKEITGVEYRKQCRELARDCRMEMNKAKTNPDDTLQMYELLFIQQEKAFVKAIGEAKDSLSKLERNEAYNRLLILGKKEEKFYTKKANLYDLEDVYEKLKEAREKIGGMYNKLNLRLKENDNKNVRARIGLLGCKLKQCLSLYRMCNAIIKLVCIAIDSALTFLDKFFVEGTQINIDALKDVCKNVPLKEAYDNAMQDTGNVEKAGAVVLGVLLLPTTFVGIILTGLALGIKEAGKGMFAAICWAGEKISQLGDLVMAGIKNVRFAMLSDEEKSIIFEKQMETTLNECKQLASDISNWKEGGEAVQYDLVEKVRTLHKELQEVVDFFEPYIAKSKKSDSYEEKIIQCKDEIAAFKEIAREYNFDLNTPSSELEQSSQIPTVSPIGPVPK